MKAWSLDDSFDIADELIRNFVKRKDDTMKATGESVDPGGEANAATVQFQSEDMQTANSTANEAPVLDHRQEDLGDRFPESGATLHERRVSWGNLVWSDFTSQKPHISSVPPSTVAGGRDSVPMVGSLSGSPYDEWPLLPWPRGPLSEFIISAFTAKSPSVGMLPLVETADALTDDDFQLALYLCYELHYRGIAHNELEWDPCVLSFRAELERVFVQRLRELSEPIEGSPQRLPEVLDELIHRTKVTDVADYLEREGTLDQMREFCVHRSASLLKSGDAASFAVARLKGRAKAAMVRIQFGDFGFGDARAMNSTYFAATMAELQLDPSDGAYIGHLPAASLAAVNLESLFGLHRRWRGALVGQVTAAKMTSADAMDHCSRAMSRLVANRAAFRYFDARATSDAIHAFIARNQMVTGLIETDPLGTDEVVFGASTYLALEDHFARYVLAAWSKQHSSLLPWGAAPHGGVPHVGNEANVSSRDGLDLST